MTCRPIIVAMLLLGGCSGQASKEAEAPFDTSLPMEPFMINVVQHAADGIYSRTGYITDDKGFRSLFPNDPEEWSKAENASLLLAELSNELLIPGRRVDEPEWDKAVLGMRQAALKGAQAAGRKNEDEFMAAALEINTQCQACHERYDSGAQ